jgi:hypothetical protein
VASPVPVQKRLRGCWCRSFLFGRRPYVISRVGLTEGWRMHIGRCGGVSSSRAPTVAGMALQCPRRWHSGGDGRIGPEVMKETRSAGLMSRRRPGRARGRWPYPFRGFPRPLSRGATWGRYRSGWYNVLELTPAFPHSSRTALGMAAQRGLVEQRRDTIPRRCQRAGRGGDSPLTRAPAARQSI